MSDLRDAQALVERAKEAAQAAYAPYSRFLVGAVAVADDGRVFQGVNVENAAYGSTQCAEATAVGCAVTAGVRKIHTVAVATIAGSGAFPCGNCRQIMQEFGVERVIVEGREGEAVAYRFADLLPHTFGAADLAPDDVSDAS